MTNASEVTQSLRGNWFGSYGVAPCPVCQFENRSDQDALTIRDGCERLLLHCKKAHCSFTDILSALGLHGSDYFPPDPETIAKRTAEQSSEREKKARQAATCWEDALPIAASPVEAYLRARGIAEPRAVALRYHPKCWHAPSARRHPAMIGAITRLDGASCKPAVHRTYICRDGSGKVNASPAKMMLGQATGGGVVLRMASGPLIVAEGIETALSVPSLTGMAGSLVAALSTSGMRSLVLPEKAGEIVVATDGDDAGEEAGIALAERAHALGWRVRKLSAPEGNDWNDILMEGAPCQR